MNIRKLSIRNILDKPLYSLLSILLVALSIGLLIGIRQLHKIFKDQLTNNINGIDMVIGAKGSPLQLVLSSVLHIDNPTGNINYREAKKLAKHPWIAKSIPVALGDNYNGYRIVGTEHKFQYLFNASLAEGTFVEHSLEAIIGDQVARNTGLKVGDQFFSSHGLIDNELDVHKDSPFKVVGIYEPTGKTIDRLIVTNLQSVWDVHDHEAHAHDEHDHHDEEHQDHETHAHAYEEHKNEIEEDTEITAMLIKFRNPMGMVQMPRKINSDTNFQAALPKLELDRLYQFTGIGVKTISWISIAILIVALLSIFISIYRMVKDRSYELALLRSYGATRVQLSRIILSEALIIGAIGFLLGIVIASIGLKIIYKAIETQYLQSIASTDIIADYLLIGTGLFVLILFVVLLAIRPILRMDISKVLNT